MTYYPRNRVYCRVPLDEAPTKRRTFRVTYPQWVLIGAAIGAVVVAIALS